ncbi:hypothetical protein CSB93_6119 [Pseudomonas paraeruginosa]|uniref:Uncharacterized protein n=1 Tax=Pseudomonas paraeruginosa TaxID=2994495 RepID=A0A2R3IVD6_9PSED|nr:hypothetical protein CSB93_6119 [Pseudomonas paraeruginosa]AWE94213.1 hypothetical protein CSC28_4920 [Pseudomonas paraeruginosa]
MESGVGHCDAARSVSQGGHHRTRSGACQRVARSPFLPASCRTLPKRPSGVVRGTACGPRAMGNTTKGGRRRGGASSSGRAIRAQPPYNAGRFRGARHGR